MFVDWICQTEVDGKEEEMRGKKSTALIWRRRRRRGAENDIKTEAGGRRATALVLTVKECVWAVWADVGGKREVGWVIWIVSCGLW